MTTGYHAVNVVPIERTAELEGNTWGDLHRTLGARIFNILDPSKSYTIHVSKEIKPYEPWLPSELKRFDEFKFSVYVEENSNWQCKTSY